MKVNNDQITSLDIQTEEPYFSHTGCANCDNGLGNDVVEVHAWVDPQKKHDYYELELCWCCVCAYHNGDPLYDDCKNVFGI